MINNEPLYKAKHRFSYDGSAYYIDDEFTGEQSDIDYLLANGLIDPQHLQGLE